MPSRSRAVALLLVGLLLLPTLAGAVGAASGSAALQEGSGSNTTETAPEGADGVPNSSEKARITPLQFEQEWLSVETRESDSTFNTSGPFAVFSITEPVDAVRIQEQSAEAELLAGGQTVRVSYAEDAAPDPEQASLYTLEIFYADGSSDTVELYATKTGVSVEAASLERYKGFIYDIRGDAKDNGYSKDPDGVEQYYSDTKERADLLDSLFVQKAQQAVGTAIAWFINPIALAITVALVALAGYYRMSRRGYALDVIANDSGKAQRLRERLRIAYKENQQTADEERLQDLPKVGSMSEIYWRDAQGVSTVYQLAELARVGKSVERDGEIVRAHHGVSELDAGSLESSWIETVAGSGRQRVASYDVALGHIKTSLERMMSTYGMGHLYRDTYREVTELIDERQQIVREGGSSYGSAGGAPSPGDD